MTRIGPSRVAIPRLLSVNLYSSVPSLSFTCCALGEDVRNCVAVDRSTAASCTFLFSQVERSLAAESAFVSAVVLTDPYLEAS